MKWAVKHKVGESEAGGHSYVAWSDGAVQETKATGYTEQGQLYLAWKWVRSNGGV